VKENTALPFQLNVQRTTMHVESVLAQPDNRGAQLKRPVLLSHHVVPVTTDVETASPQQLELLSVLTTRSAITSQLTAYNGIIVDHALAPTVILFAQPLKFAFKNQFAVQDNPIFVEPVSKLSLVTTGALLLRHALQSTQNVQITTTVVELVSVLLETGVTVLQNA